MWLYTTTTKHTIIILFPRNRRVSPIYHIYFFSNAVSIVYISLYTFLSFLFTQFHIYQFARFFYWIGFKNSSKIYSLLFFSSVCLSFTHCIFVVCLWLGSETHIFFSFIGKKKWATQSLFLSLCSPFAVATVQCTYICMDIFLWRVICVSFFEIVKKQQRQQLYNVHILVELFDWSLWIHFGFDFTLPCHLIISPFIEYVFLT